MSEHEQYLNIVWAECVSNSRDSRLQVGKKYRLGIRYHQVLKKEAYYVLDVLSMLGTPLCVDPNNGNFKEEKLDSISFIMS